MAILSKLLVALGVDVSEFGDGLDEAEKKAATASKNIGDKLGSIGKSAQRWGAGLSVGVTAPLVAMGLKATEAGSDLEEAMNKVQVVFGDSAQAVVDFSSTSAEAMGMSQRQALEATGTYGNLFTAMGIGVDASRDMSTSMVQLAADLASFNNASPEETLIALRAGLVGEAEPLKRFGVNLNAASIAAKALELGLVDVDEATGDLAGELTSAQKAQAAYALIMEQTGTAQGDFARTSEGLANSQRILKAQMEDAAASMAEQLLPIGLKVVNVARDLLARFQALSPETRKIIVIVGGLAAALGPVLMGLGTFLNILGPIVTAIGPVVGAIGAIGAVLSGPVLLAIAAVAGAIALLVAAWVNDWGGIRTTLTEVWEGTIKPALEQLWNWLGVVVPAAIETLRMWWQEVLYPAIQQVWGFIQEYVIPLFEALAGVAIAAVSLGLQALAGIWQNVLYPALRDLWSWIDSKVIPILEAVAGVVKETLGPAFDWLRTNVLEPVKAAFGRIGEIIAGIIDFLKRLADAISGVNLPDWATPGSPTPLELGLRGINEALKEMATIRLPELQVAIRPLDEPLALLAGGGQGGAGGGDTFNFYNYDQQTAALAVAMVEERRARRLNRAMGG